MNKKKESVEILSPPRFFLSHFLCFESLLTCSLPLGFLPCTVLSLTDSWKCLDFDSYMIRYTCWISTHHKSLIWSPLPLRACSFLHRFLRLLRNDGTSVRNSSARFFKYAIILASGLYLLINRETCSAKSDCNFC